MALGNVELMHESVSPNTCAWEDQELNYVKKLKKTAIR